MFSSRGVGVFTDNLETFQISSNVLQGFQIIPAIESGKNLRIFFSFFNRKHLFQYIMWIYENNVSCAT